MPSWADLVPLADQANVALRTVQVAGAITIPANFDAAVHALEMAVFYNSTDQTGRDFAVVETTTVITLMLGVWAIRRQTVA